MLRMLQNAEWKPFLDLLSPRFVDVVPMSTVLSQVRTLGGNYFDAPAFAAARQARARTLAASGLAVTLVDALPGPASPVPGAAVLELYFHQVVLGETLLLDLRAECFAPSGGGLAWSPRPAFVAKSRYGHPDKMLYTRGSGYAALAEHFPAPAPISSNQREAA